MELMFVNSIEFKRNFILLGLALAKEIIPSEKKQIKIK